MGSLRSTTVWMAAACAFLGSLVAARPAAALECVSPDTVAPILYGFTMQPAQGRTVYSHPRGNIRTDDEAPTQVGTRIDIVADERSQHPEDAFPNPVVGGIVTIDGDATYLMEPLDDRWGGHPELVFAVIPYQELSPGLHEVSIRVQDSCGNAGTHFTRVFHTPAVTLTCEGAPPGLCG